MIRRRIAMTQPDLGAHALALLEANRYLTLGTVDRDGQPWTTPVYFASAGLRQYYWISESGARHSRNLAERARVSLVVFDSTVAPYHGRALYAVATARELSGDDLDAGLAVYPGPDSRGASPVTRDAVCGSSSYRLYRATAADLWILCPREPRRPCLLHGLAADHRVRVD
jgi:hypothetical protein